MNKKIIILGIIVLTIVMVTGVTFALWQITLKQETTNALSTSCFKITFEDQNSINLSNAYPIEDEDGKKLMPYTFTIRNTCDAYASFQVNLEVLNSTTLTNLDYIKVMLDQDINLLTENTEVEKTLSDANIAYKLDTGYLDSNASITYTLRLWMDESTPTMSEFMNQVFQSKITVISTYEPEYDREAPTSNIEVTNLTNQIQVDASKSFDNKKVKYYHYSLDGENYIRTKEAVYRFDIGKLEYGSAVDTIKTLADSLSEEYTVYVKTEDEYGNLSEVVTKTIQSDFAYDGTTDNNLRYIGASPNNYISFNNELWRIIGVMNNVEDETSVESAKLKLMRHEAIGEFSWDTSPSHVNFGTGVNEWSEADLMKLLNPGYETESVGGSLYWNKQSGNCFNGRDNANSSCDFTNIGLNTNAQNMTAKVVWHTGAFEAINGQYNLLASDIYRLEKGNNYSKVCMSTTFENGIYCTDNVNRTVSWNGYVGLAYFSDYMYATEKNNRENCLQKYAQNWRNTTCSTENWFYKSNEFQRLLNAVGRAEYACDTSGILGNVSSPSSFAYAANTVRPTLFLKANVEIISGNGTEENPFELSYIE